MDVRYPAVILEDSAGGFVQFTDLDEAFTEGDSPQPGRPRSGVGNELAPG